MVIEKQIVVSEDRTMVSLTVTTTQMPFERAEGNREAFRTKQAKKLLTDAGKVYGKCLQHATVFNFDPNKLTGTWIFEYRAKPKKKLPRSYIPEVEDEILEDLIGSVKNPKKKKVTKKKKK